MRIKKVIIDMTTIAIALLLFIIWHQNCIENTTQTSSLNIENYTVYLITTDKGFQYWDIINQGASDMAALVDVNYIWNAPAERNTLKQIEIINEAVDRGANALLVAADDPKWISGAIEDAKARGVKVIYVDTAAYEEAITTLATDNYNAGVLAGETLLSILEEKDINRGSIGIINLANKENTLLREIGFRDTLVENARFNILDTIYSQTDKITQEVAERLISENEDLVALFGTSEGTTIGVGYANRANNNRYVSVGFDKTEVMTQLLKDGNLEAIIDQNPYTMGYLGMAQAVAAILGRETGPEYIDTGVSVVRREDIVH
ncbi:MAG TPA: substrate-binding domain-containing protein [Mobilitalea sp.]|nr:substrate-binding domain-containing protein [Mobilitalea sp.]